MEKIKIYAVENGKIYEAEARETPKKYIVDENTSTECWTAFEYKTHFYKDKVYRTALEAVEAKINKKEDSLEMAKRKTHVLNSELGQLKKLKKELTKPL